jgi:hypothetical protein
MPTFDLQELAIVIVVKNLDPTLISPEFLRYSNIVPVDWELAQPAVRNAQGGVQVSFTNGVGVVAYSDRITFAEVAANKPEDTLAVLAVARRFVDTLSNMDFQALGVNLRGHLAFPGEPEVAHRFMFDRLLSPGAWRELGSAPVRAGVQLVYTFDHKQLNLRIDEAMLQVPDARAVPVILFTGNFDYSLQKIDALDRVVNLKMLLQGWQADAALFRKVVSSFDFPHLAKERVEVES